MPTDRDALLTVTWLLTAILIMRVTSEVSYSTTIQVNMHSCNSSLEMDKPNLTICK